MSREADGPVSASDGGLASKTVIGAAWLLSWRVVTRLLGFVSTLVLARVLVPKDFGLVAMATAFSGLVDAFSQLGMQDALVRRVGDSNRLFDTAFTLQFGRAVATSCVIAAAAPAASWWFGEPRLTPVLFILAINSSISGLENIGIVEIRRAMRFDVQFKLLLIPRLLQVAVTISAAFLLRSYWALLLGIVTTRVARTIMTYTVHPFRPRLRLAGWRELAGFSFWTWAMSAVAVVWERVESFVLGPVVGPAQLGVYLVGMELAILPISEFVGPASDALFAAFALAQKDGKSSVHQAPLVAATMMMIIMPLTITISCASGYLVAALLGPKWAAAQTLISVLAWLCLFSPMSYVCNAVLIANNFVRRAFCVRVVAASVKLVVVLTAVTITHRLTSLAAAITACVMIESAAYMIALKGAGEVRLSAMGAPVFRILLAGATVVLCLHLAGVAWQHVAMPGALAALYCASFAAVVATLYGGLIVALWRLSGSPRGPETRLFDLVARYARNSLGRVGDWWLRAV